ncbi:hypothetical protein HAX54_051517, partial [Datura stramonium]|nr:hypothetical protein [Datura stramonium]
CARPILKLKIAENLIKFVMRWRGRRARTILGRQMLILKPSAITSKGKEVNVAKKIRKRGGPRKTDASSSALKIGEGLFVLEFPAIREKIWELGAGYIFNEPERCNLTLKQPYRDIRHTLCGEHSSARWERDQNGTHSTLAFAYFNKEAK